MFTHKTFTVLLEKKKADEFHSSSHSPAPWHYRLPRVPRLDDMKRKTPAPHNSGVLWLH